MSLAHHGLQVLQRTHANLHAGRLCGPILQFAGKGILDALLSRASGHLAALDLYQAGDGKHPDALALEGLLNFVREGLHHRDHVLLLQTGRLGDAPHDLGLRHRLATRLLRHRHTSKSQKIVCGSSPPRTGARHQVPQARPIRDSGNENATQKYGFRPQNRCFTAFSRLEQAFCGVFYPPRACSPAEFAACDTMREAIVVGPQRGRERRLQPPNGGTGRCH